MQRTSTNRTTWRVARASCGRRRASGRLVRAGLARARQARGCHASLYFQQLCAPRTVHHDHHQRPLARSACEQVFSKPAANDTMYSIKRADPINNRRAVPRPYDYVDGTIDSGTTIKDVRVASMREVITRRAEEFARISHRALADLITGAAAGDAEAGDEDGGDGERFATAAAAGGTTSRGPASPSGPRMVVHGAGDTGGVGSLTARHVPYLIVDVQEAADHGALHLLDAVPFPLTRVHADKYPAALVTCRHKEDKVIVVVDWDERAAAEVATKLVMSGQYPRVAVLTGGLQAAVESAGLPVGIPSASAIEAAVGAGGSGSGAATIGGGGFSTARGGPSGAASVAGSTVAASVRGSPRTGTRKRPLPPSSLIPLLIGAQADVVAEAAAARAEALAAAEATSILSGGLATGARALARGARAGGGDDRDGAASVASSRGGASVLAAGGAATGALRADYSMRVGGGVGGSRGSDRTASTAAAAATARGAASAGTGSGLVGSTFGPGAVVGTRGKGGASMGKAPRAL